MPALLEKLPQAELARHGPEQLTGREVDLLGSGRRLAVVVALDSRNVVARIGRGMPAHGIVVEHAEDGRHRLIPSLAVWLLPYLRWGKLQLPGGSRLSTPRRSTHIIPRTSTSTIRRPLQLRQRTTVPGA